MINIELLNESESVELKLDDNSKGGTKNYNDLDNKPKINGKELTGNLTLEDLGIIVNAVKDILINGASVVDKNGVANIPIATKSSLGIVGVNASMGIDISNVNGTVYVAKATNEQIDARTNEYKPIVPKNLDYAVKQSLCDGKGAEWTPQEKEMARNRLGINPWRLISKIEITEPIRLVTIDKDINNNDLNLKKVMIYIKAIRSADSTTNGNGRIFLNSVTPDTMVNGFYVKETTYYTNVYFELLDSGLPLGFWTQSTTSFGQYPNLKTVNMNPSLTPQESINRLKIDTDKSNCLYGEGTVFEIWGVDA